MRWLGERRPASMGKGSRRRTSTSRPGSRHLRRRGNAAFDHTAIARPRLPSFGGGPAGGNSRKGTEDRPAASCGLPPSRSLRPLRGAPRYRHRPVASRIAAMGPDRIARISGPRAGADIVLASPSPGQAPAPAPYVGARPDGLHPTRAHRHRRRLASFPSRRPRNRPRAAPGSMENPRLRRIARVGSRYAARFQARCRRRPPGTAGFLPRR